LSLDTESHKSIDFGVLKTRDEKTRSLIYVPETSALNELKEYSGRIHLGSGCIRGADPDE